MVWWEDLNTFALLFVSIIAPIVGFIRRGVLWGTIGFLAATTLWAYLNDQGTDFGIGWMVLALINLASVVHALRGGD